MPAAVAVHRIPSAQEAAAVVANAVVVAVAAVVAVVAVVVVKVRDAVCPARCIHVAAWPNLCGGWVLHCVCRHAVSQATSISQTTATAWATTLLSARYAMPTACSWCRRR